jgi:glutathione S-transferase
MKLYFTPGACSLSPHIALHEAGLGFDSEKVDLKSKKTASDADFYAVNPKGQVPVLVLDSGDVLTEGPAIVQYIADRNPGSKLAPEAGTSQRYHLQEWLNFTTSELHKGLGSLFSPKMNDGWKAVMTEILGNKLAFVAKSLEGKTYIMGEAFTVADCYLFTILNWTRFLKFDTSRWPAIESYLARVAERPKVHATLVAEGLAK